MLTNTTRATNARAGKCLFAELLLRCDAHLLVILFAFISGKSSRNIVTARNLDADKSIADDRLAIITAQRVHSVQNSASIVVDAAG